MLSKANIVLALLFISPFFCHSQTATEIDSAILATERQLANKPNYIKTCFFLAEHFMNIEQYDSAQVWLNKIQEVLPSKENSFNNYFLVTRQAEVYYYNNLQQLGLQESRRGLAMAKALNDSSLLADSYNFLGLFNMNIDSNRVAIDYYKEGLKFAKQPPYPAQYLSLSKPHHLHGNLAEAYSNLKQYENALAQYAQSLQKAQAINWPRGIAVAWHGIGNTFFATKKTDSALTSYRKGVATALAGGDIDVALVCYGGLARIFTLKNDEATSLLHLSSGFDLLKQNPNINRVYALIFLDDAIAIYKKQSNGAALIKALELKSSIETANIKGNNKQIQTVLNAGLDNERRLLSLQVQEARQKQKLANTRLLLALGGIALLVVGFFVYRYFLNQRLALSRMRQKISQDLHDDVGASLSSLQIYGTIAQQVMRSDPNKAAQMLDKINVQSRQIMENMGDIVWSMKTNSTKTITLETKIKNFAADLLSEKNIFFNCAIAPEAEAALENLNARKNVLLIIKEIINNAAKYSEANNVSLKIYIEEKNWILQIADDGIGFAANGYNQGNGMANIRNRCAALNGVCTLTSEQGTQYLIVLPTVSLSDSGW